MHGTSTAERIVSIASSHASALGLPSVKVVRVRIAAWSHITEDELRACFESASRGKPTEGADLKIDIYEPSCRCEACGKDFNPDRFTLRCPSCGSPRVVMDKSREVEVESVEV
ncbi:MAG: hydrogenase maturation nickel metallochaperone HypA [Armatimonadetes bacterium]|nr:hydrogenase maturation nickel metallochaperone HypA [Armatimonadota bacterium]